LLVTPIFIGFLNAFCFGASDYLSRDVTRRIGYFKTTTYVLLLSGIGVLLTAPLLGLSFEIGGTMIGLLVLVSAANFLGFIFMYRGFQTGLLSVVSPLVNSFPAFTTIISLLLLGGSLSPITATTLAVIMAGAILVSTRLSELIGHLRGSVVMASVGAGSGLVAALLFGMTWAGFGYAEQNVGYLLPALFMRAGSAAIGFVSAPFLKQVVQPRFNGVSRRLILMGVLETVGVFSFALNLRQINGGQALPIVATFGGMGTVFTVALAVAILKERVEKNQAIGIILLVAGVGSLLYLTA
jgi:uncharacterized membrane protein